MTDALDATRRRTAASGYAEPTEPVGGWWTARFALVWFGAWMGTLVPVQLLLPEQLEKLDPVHKVRDFGLVNGLTGVLALVTLPLLGAWCDRTTSRFGRRRVWVLSGAVVFAAGLVATGLQTHWVGVGLAWLVASSGMNAASVGLTATVADRVPERQRGTISGALYGPQAVGVVVGLLLVTTVVTSVRGGYVLLAVAVLVCAAPFVLRYREAVVPGAPRLSAAEVVAGLWEVPRHNRDFAWAFGSRILVNLGNALGTTYLLYFLTDGLKVADPEGELLVLTVIYLVFTLIATFAGGYLSDRYCRRRVFVAVASCLQAVAALMLAGFPSLGVAMVGAGFLGAGYGAFMSVDQALVTQVLPDAASRAKDLGIMNIGSVGPQALAPLLASLLISTLGGYPTLFAVAGVTTLLGAAIVYRVRSVA
ncbi:MAG TPA: MFS transporter [Actinomycetales bacterium]|nr:MFS transporter [Actinomycetales bacterium]